MLASFNVCLPFQRVIMVQMNMPMRDLLVDFFQELCDDETEEEVRAFGDALQDPSIYVHAVKADEPSFLICEKYMGVVVAELNEAMRNLICGFIDDVDGVETQIIAFSRALRDPLQSLEIRLDKLREQNEPDKVGEYSDKVRRRKLTMV